MMQIDGDWLDQVLTCPLSTFFKAFIV